MKIMGRVARLILLVVVSVCVVFCVLCCLQNNPVFLSVTILSHILKNENYELCISAGFFVDQITTGKKYDQKKRYSHLAVGWNKSQITVCHVKIQTPTITRKNYDRKKKLQSCARQLDYVSKYEHQILRPEKITTGRKKKYESKTQQAQPQWVAACAWRWGAAAP
jgi:hypothetical protein